ncbi:MAG: hypothetical protein R2705_00050 [Ilumatobacteraceae bacterium]
MVWLPPLIDQLTREPGNLSILKYNFTHPDAPYLAKGLVMRAFGSELSVLGPWMTGPALVTRNLPGVVVTLALWAAAIRLAWRRRDRSALTLHGLLALATVLALFSVERIFGAYFEYTVRWFWVLTATIIASSVWTIWRCWARRWLDEVSGNLKLLGV